MIINENTMMHRELEENHLIYTFPQELPDSYVLYYEGKQDDRRMQQVSHISIGPSLILQRNSMGIMTYAKMEDQF